MRPTAPLLLLALPLVLLAGGCYRHTVSSKGMGGIGARTQPEYRSNTAADRAVDSMLGRPTSPARKYDEVHYDEKR